MEFVTGLIGVFVGAFLSAFFTRQESKRQTRINTTLKMYERFQSILSSRLIADQLLEKNLAAPHPLTYTELKRSLSPENWQHVSRTRSLYNELGLLYRAGYLDVKLAKLLFAPTFQYWYDSHLLKMEANSKDTDTVKWIVAPDEIATWLLK